MSRPIRDTEHGTNGFAKRTKCTCDPCRKARRMCDKRARLRKMSGNSRQQDPTQARAHVAELVAAGATYYQIARASGRVHESQIRRLMEGNAYGGTVQYLFAETITALLSVRLPAALAQESLRPAIGVHRRMEALCYMGYSMVDIAQGLGVTDRCVFNYYSRPRLMTSTIAKIDAYYRSVCMIPGTDDRSRWRAYRNDFAPPMAWEDNIDDPDAMPDRSAIVCIIAKCGGVMWDRGLCHKHYRRVSEMKGFRDTERFREVVRQLGNKVMSNKVATLAMIADLKELGVSKEEAAKRVNRGLDYVDGLWESA